MSALVEGQAFNQTKGSRRDKLGNVSAAHFLLLLLSGFHKSEKVSEWDLEHFSKLVLQTANVSQMYNLSFLTGCLSLHD